MADSNDIWITPAEAVEMVSEVAPNDSTEVIKKRAGAGMIAARAKLLQWGKETTKDAEIPPEFWKDSLKSHEDWRVGDFRAFNSSTSVSASAFGVTFHRAHVQQLLPSSKIPVSQGLSIETRLKERPKDVRDAARSLSQAIANQIDYLNSNIPNDPDALDRQERFVAFLREIEAGLDELANILESASNARSPDTSATIFAKAAATARHLGAIMRDGLSEHRTAVVASAIQVPVLACGVGLLHVLGVSPDTATATVAAIMGVSVATSASSSRASEKR
jgi:hypothetical protein